MKCYRLNNKQTLAENQQACLNCAAMLNAYTVPLIKRG